MIISNNELYCIITTPCTGIYQSMSGESKSRVPKMPHECPQGTSEVFLGTSDLPSPRMLWEIPVQGVVVTLPFTFNYIENQASY